MRNSKNKNRRSGEATQRWLPGFEVSWNQNTSARYRVTKCGGTNEESAVDEYVQWSRDE